ncbi:MAG: RnfABCDGE type electron transport complex subunit D [Bacilli bacterium]|nr:RnfABCDGE type electron transport complex subunit D [Bacilli bacterium]
MNKTYIFSKENNKENLFYLAVLPLILYGLYKNGYLLISNKYITKAMLIKVILYPLISTLIGYIFGKIFKKKEYNLLTFGILAGLTAPYNFNIIAYFSIVIGMMFLVMYVPNRLKLNEPALLISILILLNAIFNNSVLFNPMEVTSYYKYSLFDLFFGRGASFIYTSSIFWLLISYIVLSFIKVYKKNIFIYEVCTFLVCFLIYMFITKEFSTSAVTLFNGITFFSFIFLAPINEASPSINIEIIIYSIFNAILAFVLIFIFNIFTGAVIATLISSILYRIYDIIRQKRLLK